MPCPRCHAATPPSVRFCPECGAALPTEAPTARTSRRQMTVLFCDLVGSTDLAQRVDPDDLLVALQTYHELVRQTSARFGGFIARIVGDGIDVYFGYPVANEDDAPRALHTALALVAEVPRIEVVPGEPLAVRIGIATGTVAVSVSQGVALAGLTPNLAARIQATVPPGAVGVAPSTRRLAGGQFEFEDLGEQTLKGFDAPVAISRLRGATSLDSRSAWRGRDTSLPIVGRDAELTALLAHAQRAAAGRTCGALVVGEPGMGKSRLVSALDSALPVQGHTLLRLQCSPFHVNSALQPFVLHLSAAAGLARGDTAAEQLDKLEAQMAIAGIDDANEHALIAALLGVPSDGRYPPLAMPAPLQLHLTKEALKHYFTSLAHRQAHAEQPSTSAPSGAHDARLLLVVIEDMHWIDPTSLELIDQLLASGGDAPILLLMTARSEFQSPWRAGADFVQLNLQRLTDADAKAIARQQPRRDELPADWLDTIIERTDGVPLFIEEMTRMLLDRRAAQNAGDAVSRGVPDTLMDLLTERLDRLPPDGKLLAQVASVVGREFDRELLGATLPEEGAALTSGLQAMLDSGLVLLGSADGERLVFKHALVEDTAYASLPPKRCAELHGRVADALLTRFTHRVQQQPELAARHLSRALRRLEAAPWWEAAGGQALSRGAPREAAGHLRAGLAVLEGMPVESSGLERDAAELGLLSMLGPTTMVLLGPGSAEFGAVQERAYRLSQALPEQPRLFPTSYGWCLFNWGRARLDTAKELVDGLLGAAAQRASDPEAVMAANNMAGMVQFHRGQAETARKHLTTSTSLYEPKRDAALYPVYMMDFGVFGRFYLALATQVLGEADSARRIAAEALQLAEGLNQPHTMGFALLANFNTAVMRGDHAEALPMAERCLEFAGQFGFPEFVAMARFARGWALAHGQQRWDEGLAEVRAGIAGWAQTGFENWQPWFVALEAEILGHLGGEALALEHIEQQLARIRMNGERQFESLLLAERAAALAPAPAMREQAASGFDAAAALAREQGARAWEARIAARRAQVLS